MEKIILILIIILIIISIIYCYIKIDISYFDIEDEKIDKNIKIMFLSDLHNRNIFYKLKTIIKQNKPDIIICGGDMVNESLDKLDNFLKLDIILKKYKTYYTFGNHELKLCEEEYYKYLKKLNKMSIILLNNQSTKISKNIKLYGFVSEIEEYRKFYNTSITDKTIIKKLGKTNQKYYNILIAHNPLEYNSYVDCKYDLVLCGHIHGGLIKLPLLGGILSPNYRLFPKYYEGIYKKDNTSMIVSRGLGFSKRIPFRIFNNPEVIIINLKSKNR